MSILPMYKKCPKCKRRYSYNPSVGEFSCPYCFGIGGIIKDAVDLVLGEKDVADEEDGDNSVLLDIDEDEDDSDWDDDEDDEDWDEDGDDDSDWDEDADEDDVDDEDWVEEDEFRTGEVIKIRSIFSNISPKEIWHFGVVVGYDDVVHFNLDDEFDIRIIRTNLAGFVGNGSQLQRAFSSNQNAKYSPDKIAKRAKRKVGSDFGGYNLITNNCEHFANWCVSGEKFCDQLLYDEGEDHTVLDKLGNRLADWMAKIREEREEDVDDEDD